RSLCPYTHSGGIVMPSLCRPGVAGDAGGKRQRYSEFVGSDAQFVLTDVGQISFVGGECAIGRSGTVEAHENMNRPCYKDPNFRQSLAWHQACRI
ncbi:hypothetical protein FA15DRAFT_674742, partial [Coprinopsis marcescibilis]